LRQLKALVAQSVDKLATLRVAKLKLQAPQPDNLENWIEKAELNNPQFQSLKAKVEVARFEVDRARSGHHPTVDAVAQWSRSESENVTNTSSRYTNAAVGLYLNMPLFAGGAVNSAVRQALASLQFAEQSLELGRRDLGARVHKEFRGVTESMAKIQALEDAVLSADQVVLSNQKSLQAGIRTLIDVLNAEQQRIVTLRELSQARYTYLASQVRLLALVGEADGTFMAKINQVLE
jgi:protease secretion system outer membrane protein